MKLLILATLFIGAISCEKLWLHCCSEKYDYIYYSGHADKSRKHAEEKCKHKGGKLADVDSANIMCLSGSLTEPAYIASWNTDSYQGAHIALYPNGAIAVPPGPDNHAFICQVPKCYHHRQLEFEKGYMLPKNFLDEVAEAPKKAPAKKD